MMPFLQEVVFWCFFVFNLLIFFASKKTFRILIFTKIPLRNGKFWSTHCTLLQPCSTTCTLFFWSKRRRSTWLGPRYPSVKGHKQKLTNKDMFMLRLFFSYGIYVSFWKRLDNFSPRCEAKVWSWQILKLLFATSQHGIFEATMKFWIVSWIQGILPNIS